MSNQSAKENDPFKGKKTGGWTKYDGARHGLERSQAEETWTCQACGHEQPTALPGFMLELAPKSQEYVKVCADCFHIARQYGYSYRRITLIVRLDE